MKHDHHRRKLSLLLPAFVFLSFSALERVDIAEVGNALDLALRSDDEPLAEQIVLASDAPDGATPACRRFKNT